jgi:hypothetical protein
MSIGKFNFIESRRAVLAWKRFMSQRRRLTGSGMQRLLRSEALECRTVRWFVFETEYRGHRQSLDNSHVLGRGLIRK